MDAIYCNNCNTYVETSDGICPNCKDKFEVKNLQDEAPPIFIGWLCPKCQKIWSPAIEYCHDCQPVKNDKNTKVLLENKE